MRPDRLLIVGNPGQEHVGAHLLAAARQLPIEASLIDSRAAWSESKWVNRVCYRLLQHRPARLAAFSRKVVESCQDFRPGLLMVTGISAPSAEGLRAIGRMGVARANFLTDDPWNSRNAAGFFWSALREYDVIYSPRQANLADLRLHGCRSVDYLPFGYNPELHFPEPPSTPAEHERFDCDVAIVGGADKDRAPLAMALARAGLKLALYGGYWDRWKELKRFYRGFVHGRELRMAVSAATVNVCMVRKANRDGHAMRSLELPAMGACLLAEDTPEHRQIFGDAGDCVDYYTSTGDLVSKASALCAQPDLARGRGEWAFRRICREARHTYADRLRRVLDDVSNAKSHG